MKRVDGVIIQGDGSLFYFDHKPLCQFLAKAKNKFPDSAPMNPETIWEKVSCWDLVYCNQTGVSNPLESYNKGGTLESFFENIKRVLLLDKLDYEEFSHIWHSSVHIPSSRMHRIISKLKVPVVAIINTNPAHWEKVHNYFERSVNCYVLSFESKITMPSTDMLILAHKTLEDKMQKKFSHLRYLGQHFEYLSIADELGIWTHDTRDPYLPRELETLGIM